MPIHSKMTPTSIQMPFLMFRINGFYETRTILFYSSWCTCQASGTLRKQEEAAARELLQTPTIEVPHPNSFKRLFGKPTHRRQAQNSRKEKRYKASM